MSNWRLRNNDPVHQPLREFRRDQLCAVDLCALWNAKKRVAKDNVWRGLDGKFLVLPHTWKTDLLKHHAKDCKEYLASFLNCGLCKDRILIAAIDTKSEQYNFLSLAKIIPAPEYEPSRSLEVEVEKENAELVSQYLTFLDKFRGAHSEFIAGLSPVDLNLLSRLRKGEQLSEVELGSLALHVARLLQVNVRLGIGSGLDFVGQRANLAFCLVILREHAAIAKRNHDELNDVYDLQYLTLGGDFGQLRTADHRLKRSFQVYLRTLELVKPLDSNSQ